MIRGDTVALRPTEPADRAALKAIRDEPGVVRRWGEQTAEWPGDDDILLATRAHGRGLGSDAMRAIIRHLIEERGHHRITLTTWPHNARAIHVYEKLGFRRVGVTRLSERGADGSWHDELLMELVVEPRPG